GGDDDDRAPLGGRHVCYRQTQMTAHGRTSVHLIGVPLDLGGGRRGVDMGPSALRIAGLSERLSALGYSVADRGDLVAPIREIQELRHEHKKYITEIAHVCQDVEETALASLL